MTPAEFPQLAVRSPRLWWPNGLGRPELYHLTLTFVQDGGVSDVRSVRFGDEFLEQCAIDAVDRERLLGDPRCPESDASQRFGRRRTDGHALTTGKGGVGADGLLKRVRVGAGQVHGGPTPERTMNPPSTASTVPVTNRGASANR